MKNYKIKNATACYTGGNIYIYYGELENGNYFSTSDLWDFISILDEEPNDENLENPEFFEEHEIECETDMILFDNILQWIIDHAPAGNYQAGELRERLENIEPDDDKPLFVCEHCLQAIESHEGAQRALSVYVDGDEPRACQWCHTRIQDNYGYEI